MFLLKLTSFFDIVVEKKSAARFNVTKEGYIKVVRGVSPEINQVIIRVLKASPKWIPAEKDGKKADAQMTLPIHLQPK